MCVKAEAGVQRDEEGHLSVFTQRTGCLPEMLHLVIDSARLAEEGFAFSFQSV